jgi:hypothetical protein
MTYVEYMRRLGVSVEPVVKAEPVVEHEVWAVRPLPTRLQTTIDRFISGLPRKHTAELNANRGNLQSNLELYEFSGAYTDLILYYRLAVEAVDAELAHRNSTPL